MSPRRRWVDVVGLGLGVPALAAGAVFAGFALFLVLYPGWWTWNTEGSPAGAIIFAVVASFGLVSAVTGIPLLLAGAYAATRIIPSLLLRIVVALTAVPFLTAAAAKGYQLWLYPEHGEIQKRMAAAARPAPPPRDTGLPDEPGAPPGARDRARYDECVAHVRQSHRREWLNRCADELVAAWDRSVAARKRFANMPDHAEFAGWIGEMYVSYAEATNDVSAGLAGVRTLRKRVEDRHPKDAATLARLREQESRLLGDGGR